MGYEKFMMDLDLCGAAHTYLKGCRPVDDDQFALDGFAEIGPGKHFFSAQHTLRHYETAFYDRRSQRQHVVRAVARRRRTQQRGAGRGAVREALANYVAPPIDDAVDAALLDFVDRRKASMPDQWY